MRKGFEINGCIEGPPGVREDTFWKKLIEFVESNGWSFGGGIKEIQDGFYILSDGSYGSSVIDDSSASTDSGSPNGERKGSKNGTYYKNTAWICSHGPDGSSYAAFCIGGSFLGAPTGEICMSLN